MPTNVTCQGEKKFHGKANNLNRAVKCPSCHVPMAPEAVICIQCGYDTRSGKKLTTKRESQTTITGSRDNILANDIEDNSSGDGMWIMKAANFCAVLTMVLIWKLTGMDFLVAVFVGVIAIPVFTILYLIVFSVLAAPFSFLIPGNNCQR